jgi:hypothetical protein
VDVEIQVVLIGFSRAHPSLQVASVAGLLVCCAMWECARACLHHLNRKTGQRSFCIMSCCRSLMLHRCWCCCVRKQDGVECSGSDKPVEVCGTCGAIYDSSFPLNAAVLY